MDEVPFWFDMPKLRTYNQKEEMSVPIKTTGNEKLRITLVLSALSNRSKCKPMIVFKGLKKIPRGEFLTTVVIQLALKRTVQETLMIVFNREIWQRKPGGLFRTGPLNKTLLVMDSHRAHLTQTVKNSFKKSSKTDIAIVPGEMIHILQPADFQHNRSFEAAVKDEWKKWISSQLAKSNNEKVKRVSYIEIAKWVEKCWYGILGSQIIDASYLCGISKEQNEEKYHSRLRKLLRSNCYVSDEAEIVFAMTGEESDNDD